MSLLDIKVMDKGNVVISVMFWLRMIEMYMLVADVGDHHMHLK